MAETRPPIAIVGIHVGRPEIVLDCSLEEMTFAAAQATVAEAGLTFEDIDGVVVSATDQVDGRVISCMVGSGPAAGVGRDLMMIASASEHALPFAYMRLLAGQGRNVLVLSWGKPSESVAPEHAELVAAEPFVLRPHGLNDTVAAALQASVLVCANGTPGVPSDRDGYVSWPLTRDEVLSQGDAVCGLLLTVADAVPAGVTPVWIRGAGWATDRYELGDRDLVSLPALRSAARQAFNMAGIDDAPAADAVRVHCPSVYAFPAALNAMALTDASARLVNAPDGDGPAYPSHVAGLAAMALAAREIRDDAGARLAVGAALHGFAGQGAAVAVFSATPEA